MSGGFPVMCPARDKQEIVSQLVNVKSRGKFPTQFSVFTCLHLR